MWGRKRREADAFGAEDGMKLMYVGPKTNEADVCGAEDGMKLMRGGKDLTYDTSDE